MLGLSTVFILMGLQSGFWPGSVVFGLAAIVATIILFRPSRLILETDGFTATTLGRSFRYHWSDIARFGVTTVAGQKMVGLDFAEGYPRSKAMKTSRGLSGFDGALPDTYGREAEHLVSLLEEWRQRRLRRK